MTILGDLAEKYGTDKRPLEHNYTQMYERFLRPGEVDSLLEVGLGSGASLRMWIDYLPEAKIYCIESFGEENELKWDKADGKIEKLNLIAGDSTKEDTWDKIPFNLDVIIDDGEHHPDSQWATFEQGFPHLRKGGLYFIEDTHCNWLENYTGKKDLMYGKIFDLIIKQQTPQICIGGNFYAATPYMPPEARLIYSYHFYKSVVILEKAI